MTAGHDTQRSGTIVWLSNAVTSVVHLVEDGYVLCGERYIILAEVDEGGVACGRCLRLFRKRPEKVPRRG